VGRSYESIIQINSQSGKGGVAYILNSAFGYKIPKQMEPYVGKVIQAMSDKHDGVLSEKMIGETFQEKFINCDGFYKVENINITIDKDQAQVEGDFIIGDVRHQESQEAQGIIEAVSKVFKILGVNFEVVEYSEHALTYGTDSEAIAYFGVRVEGVVYYGAGLGRNISYASINALISALNVSVQ
jgi:2-isopropylmalate synthase